MYYFIRILLILFFFVANTWNSNAFNCTSISAGNWHSNSTWDCANYPSGSNCPDTIFIDQNVYLTNHIDLTSCPPIVIILTADLTFKSGKKMQLPKDSKVIINIGGRLVPEGGGGNSNYIQIDGTTVWNAGDGIVGPGTVLGITLGNFYSKIQDYQVHLFWETLSETNNDYFEVEHSTDGLHFEKLQLLKGAGNSSSLVEYKYVHKNPILGVNYYRLKQTDYDGAFTYTHTISVQFGEYIKGLVYPNPNHGTFKINTKFSTSIHISSIAGKQVYTSGQYYGETIDVNHLPAGIYFIQYFINEMLVTEKFVKN